MTGTRFLSILRYCFALSSLLAIMFCLPGATAASDGILLREDFKEARKGAGNINIIHPHGSSYAKYEKGETALKLTGDSYAELQVPQGLTTEAGTIAFRFKPLWDRKDPASHPFLTLRWDDKRQSYLALSYGWWEPEGKRHLYFVLSNQDSIAFSTPLDITCDYWTEITVTWKSGPDGYCRIFVDGEFRAEHRFDIKTASVPKGHLFIGSDRGATDQRGRRSDFLIDKLLILNRPMSKLEVLQDFERQRDLAAPMENKERSWIEESIRERHAAAPVRDGAGLQLERRVLFDEDMEWATSSSAADRIIRRVKAAGFNVYIPCVWHGDGAYFPSRRVMVHPALQKAVDGGYDPLAYLITKAHAEGIEVHPWFTVTRREGAGIKDFYCAGSPENAYDVHNEGFRRFIIGLMLEVVERYPVDGINLDYIRSQGICTCESCADGYFRATRRTLAHDAAEADAYKDTKGASGVIAWNSRTVTAIVREFSRCAKQLRKGLIISVDAVPGQQYLLIQGQDSIRWSNEGLIDVIFYMDYAKRPDLEMVDKARNKLSNPARLTTLLATYDFVDEALVPEQSRSRVKITGGGVALVSRSGPLLADYVRLARAIWPGSGIAFYHAKQLTDEQTKALTQTVFDVPARPLWP
jgi:hypothetical protein